MIPAAKTIAAAASKLSAASIVPTSRSILVETFKCFSSPVVDSSFRNCLLRSALACLTGLGNGLGLFTGAGKSNTLHHRIYLKETKNGKGLQWRPEREAGGARLLMCHLWHQRRAQVPNFLKVSATNFCSDGRLEWFSLVVFQL